MRQRLVVLAIGVVLAPPTAGNAQGAALPPFVELRVPKPPTVATGDGVSFLAYEMHVTNFTSRPMTLQRVEVGTLPLVHHGMRPVGRGNPAARDADGQHAGSVS